MFELLLLLIVVAESRGFFAFEHSGIKEIEHFGIYRSQCKGRAAKDVAQVEELKEKEEKRFLCISSPSVQFILSGLSLPFTHKIDFNWKSPQELTADNMIEIVSAGLKVLVFFSFLISI